MSFFFAAIHSQWRSVSQLSQWCRLAPVAALLALLTGCSSGSSTTKSTTLLKGNAAHRAAVIAGYQSFASSVAYPFNALKIANPTGSPIKNGKAATASASSVSLSSVSLSQLFTMPARPKTTCSASLTFIPALNLYAADLVANTNVLTLSYFSDAAGTLSAGSVIITLPINATDTNYTTYPVRIPITVNLTGGNLPCNGTVTITFTGATGKNTMTGTLTLPKNNITFTLNLALTDDLQVSGSITSQENGATIRLTNCTGPLFGDLHCDLEIDPYGWKGTATGSFLTGQFSTSVNTSTGISSSTVDASGNLVITYPDKTTETVTNPLIATLIAGGNSTTGTTGTTGTGTTGTGTTGTGTTGTGTTGTGTTGSAAYNAPVQLVIPQGYTSVAHVQAITSGNIALGLTGNAVGVYATAWTSATNAVILPPLQSAAGTPDIQTIAQAGNTTQIVGGSGSSFYQYRPIVWTGASYTPQALQNSDSYGLAVSINAGGQIVGVGGTTTTSNTVSVGLASIGLAHALYWSSATAAPTILTPLVTGGYAGAFSINTNGQIVGVAYNAAGTLVPVYWSSPSAAPIALALPSGVTSVNVAGIDNFGHIAGYAITGDSQYTAMYSPLFWSSPSAVPTVLPLPSGATGGAALSIAGNGLVAGYVVTSGTIHAAVWNNQKVEDLNDTLPAKSPYLIETAQSINDQGNILAFAIGSDNLYFTLASK